MIRSVAVMSMWPGRRREDLEPRIHITDDLSKAKFRRHRRRPITEPYGVECFSERNAPSLFRVTVAHGPKNRQEFYSCVRTQGNVRFNQSDGSFL